MRPTGNTGNFYTDAGDIALSRTAMPSKLHPCLCGFVPESKWKWKAHAKQCQTWLSRPRKPPCPHCGRGAKRGHEENCHDFKQTKDLASRMGSTKAAEGLLLAAARRGLTPPEQKAIVAMVVDCEPVGKSFLLVLDCGHMIRRPAKVKMTICRICTEASRNTGGNPT